MNDDTLALITDAELLRMANAVVFDTADAPTRQQIAAIKQMAIKILRQRYKPCPFCSATGEKLVMVNNAYESHVKCTVCLATGPQAETGEQAKQIWNKQSEGKHHERSTN